MVVVLVIVQQDFVVVKLIPRLGRQKNVLLFVVRMRNNVLVVREFNVMVFLAGMVISIATHQCAIPFAPLAT
jgi:hypothetical protein